ncbi:MAG: tetratricopeptide repeat protein [Gemmatimonadales bacterium]
MIRLGLLAVLLCPAAAAAQGTAQIDDDLAAGRSHAADPAAALAWYRRVLATDSLNYEANWRAAVALVDLGEDYPDEGKVPARDSLYQEALRHARVAAEDTTRSEGAFALALALGRIALTRSRTDRVSFAEPIYDAANRALALDPNQDGAHHILGLWNAEARRLSGVSRFFAKSLLGGGILGRASWAAAIEHLEAAVRIDPNRIYHRLDLARVYADRKRYSDAREQLDAIERLPDRERHDPEYRREAATLRQRIAGKKDDPQSGTTDGG